MEHVNLTTDSRQLLEAARKTSDLHHLNYVCTETLLLAICDSRSLAANLKRLIGFDAFEVRRVIQRNMAHRRARRLPGSVPFSHRVQRILALAQSIAEKDQGEGTLVEPLHIFLGILKEGGSDAAHALQGLGLRYEIIDPKFKELSKHP